MSCRCFSDCVREVASWEGCLQAWLEHHAGQRGRQVHPGSRPQLRLWAAKDVRSTPNLQLSLCQTPDQQLEPVWPLGNCDKQSFDLR